MLLSTTIYGVTPSLVAFSRGEVSVIDMVAYRTAIAAILFVLLARLRRAWAGPGVASPRRNPAGGLLIGAVLWGPQVMLYYASFAYIDTSLAVAIGFFYPTIVLLLASVASRSWPGRPDVVLSIVAVVGIAALLLPGSDAGVHPAGAALAGAAACGYAVYVLLADSVLRDVDLFAFGAQVSVGATLSAVAVGWYSGHLSILQRPNELLMVGVQAVLLVAATSCYYGGLIRLGSTQASLVDTAQPAVALVAGAVLLGERMAAVQLVGVALVTASVAVSSALAQRRTSVPYADPP